MITLPYLDFTIHLDTETGVLHFPDNGVTFREQKYRRLGELVSVLRYPPREETLDDIVYTMYYDVHTEGSANILHAQGLRYDITVLLPNALYVGELPKTAGHYHPVRQLSDGQRVHYPELYHVLFGKAGYVIQNADMREAHVFSATAGDLVKIPGNMGHITTNLMPHVPLVMANLVRDDITPDYTPLQARHGGACYIQAVDDKGLDVVMNPQYSATKLRYCMSEHILSHEASFFTDLLNNVGDFAFVRGEVL